MARARNACCAPLPGAIILGTTHAGILRIVVRPLGLEPRTCGLRVQKGLLRPVLAGPSLVGHFLDNRWRHGSHPTTCRLGEPCSKGGTPLGQVTNAKALPVLMQRLGGHRGGSRSMAGRSLSRSTTTGRVTSWFAERTDLGSSHHQDQAEHRVENHHRQHRILTPQRGGRSPRLHGPVVSQKYSCQVAGHDGP